jgi:hypothetical protein
MCRRFFPPNIPVLKGEILINPSYFQESIVIGYIIPRSNSNTSTEIYDGLGAQAAVLNENIGDNSGVYVVPGDRELFQDHF